MAEQPAATTPHREPALDWHGRGLPEALAAAWPGLVLQAVAETGSTNTDLMDRARAGHRGPCLRVAEHQHQGRGRQGKAWVAQPGASLTFSLALVLQPADWSGLSLAVGLALAEAIEPLAPTAPAPPRLGLKWPNDLLLRDPAAGPGGRKLGGILIETLPAGGERVAVIGIGLNLQPLPASLWPADWQPGDVQALLPGIDGPALLARVAPPLLRALRAFERDGFAPLQGAYARRDTLAGQPVRAQSGLGATTAAATPPQDGVADGVDAHGTLWLRQGGQRLPVHAGEVSIRPLAAVGAG